MGSLSVLVTAQNLRKPVTCREYRQSLEEQRAYAFALVGVVYRQSDFGRIVVDGDIVSGGDDPGRAGRGASYDQAESLAGLRVVAKKIDQFDGRFGS